MRVSDCTNLTHCWITRCIWRLKNCCWHLENIWIKGFLNLIGTLHCPLKTPWSIMFTWSVRGGVQIGLGWFNLLTDIWARWKKDVLSALRLRRRGIALQMLAPSSQRSQCALKLTRASAPNMHNRTYGTHKHTGKHVHSLRLQISSPSNSLQLLSHRTLLPSLVPAMS